MVILQCGLWFIPIVLKLLNFDMMVIRPVFYLMAVSSICFVAKNPKMMLMVLPFFALFSPLAGYLQILGGKYLCSDLLFILLCGQIFYLYSMKCYRHQRHDRFMTIFFLMMFVNALMAIILGLLLSPKILMQLLQFGIIYFYLVNFCTEKEEHMWMLNVWLIAVIGASLLLIQSYFTGELLADFNGVLENVNLEEYQSQNILYRVGYYYSGFIFPLGITLILLSQKFFFAETMGLFIMYLLGIGICFFALVVTANKTAMFSVFIVIVFISMFLMRKSRWLNLYRKNFLKNFCLYIAILGCLPAGVSYFLMSNQLDLFLGRLSEVSSLLTRTDIYVAALSAWSNFPLQWIIGMGMGFLEHGAGNVAILFTTSHLTGFSEGTVDSGWLSYLIELGIPLFIGLLSLFFRSIINTYKNFITKLKCNNIDLMSLNIFSALLYTAISLTTQMLGYSKTSWIIFELMVIGCLHYKPLAIRRGYDANAL